METEQDKQVFSWVDKKRHSKIRGIWKMNLKDRMDMWIFVISTTNHHDLLSHHFTRVIAEQRAGAC
jgi:hypothetical protein